MSFRPSGTLALTAASIVLMGGVAFAGVQSIDTEPPPQVVIPASTHSDDPAGHDVDDDHGDQQGRQDRDGRHGADDPASHDDGDDHGGLRGGRGDDDPATHDVADDHGGLSGSDDSGSDDSGSGSSGSGSGSDDSGSGSSGSGSSGSGSDD